MKRVKFAVAAIAVVFAIGSAFAFHGKKSQLYIFQKNAEGTECPLLVSGLYEIVPTGGTQVTNALHKTSSTQPPVDQCNQTFRYSTEQ